jgi:hypothetical protein
VAPKRSQPTAEDGIGQEAHPVEFDQERRVAEVRDAKGTRRLVSRL